MLDRRIKETLRLSEGHNLVKLPFDFPPRHSQDGPVQIDVLPARQVLMESHAHFQKVAHPAAHLRHSLSGAGDPGEDFQQRGLAGPVAPQEADHLPFRHLKGDIAQGPDLGGGGGPLRRKKARHSVPQSG